MQILNPQTVRSALDAAGRLCRNVALGVIAGVTRRIGFHQIEARIVALPMRDQVAIVGGILAAMFLLSLLAAQFGWIGIALYLLAIVLLIG